MKSQTYTFHFRDGDNKNARSWGPRTLIFPGVRLWNPLVSWPLCRNPKRGLAVLRSSKRRWWSIFLLVAPGSTCAAVQVSRGQTITLPVAPGPVLPSASSVTLNPSSVTGGKTVELRERNKVIARIIPAARGNERPVKFPDFAVRAKKVFGDRILPGADIVIAERGRY